MCLIIVGHRASPRFPLVIAANRDEEHARPASAVAEWDDAPGAYGGRDLRAGGAWLAVTRTGRFAAVTNLRGGRVAGARSRGALVRDFVVSELEPLAYARDVAAHASEYGGFHLLAGIAGEVIAHATTGLADARIWPEGVDGISNAADGEPRWPKVDAGVARMRELLDRDVDSEELTDGLLAFLAMAGEAARRRGRTLPEEAPHDPFILGDRYGTRSSAVVIVSAEGLKFIEKTWPGSGQRPEASGQEGVVTRVVVK